MKTVNRALLSLALAVSFTASQHLPASAEEAIGKVTAVKQSGWATRMNDSVKKTIKVGDKVYEGDVLDIKHGNFVEIALDKEEKNVLRFDGNTLVQVFEKGKHNIELKRGTAYALLDDLSKTQNRFSIATPTAVSAVRGTYFKAEANGSQSATTVYQGIVMMSGRAENGRELQSETALNPGMKAQVEDFAKNPSEPAKISRQEFEEINELIKNMGGKRALLNYDAIMSGDAGHKGEHAGGTADNIEVKAEKSKASQDETESGNVVF